MKIDSDKIVNRGLETCLIGDLKFFLNNSRFVSPLTAFLYFLKWHAISYWGSLRAIQSYFKMFLMGTLILDNYQASGGSIDPEKVH